MNPDLHARMNALADKLLTAAETAELDVQLKIFAEVGRWLAIGQAPTADPAARPPAKRLGFQHDPPEVQRRRALKRWDPKSRVKEPSGLAAIRALIPPRSAPTVGEAAGGGEG
jgi:hypothetical protein